MNTHNLHRLINLFESLPDHKVNLNCWRTLDKYGYVGDDLLVNDDDTCGCIVGWLPVLTGVPVQQYSYLQLARFLDIPIDMAIDIGDASYDYETPCRVIALERLRGLLTATV
jgi:hypothetical protein